MALVKSRAKNALNLLPGKAPLNSPLQDLSHLLLGLGLDQSRDGVRLDGLAKRRNRCSFRTIVLR